MADRKKHLTRLERWIGGDPNRKLTAFTESDAIIVAEETAVLERSLGRLGVYRKDKLVLTREEAEWAVWALQELLKR